MGGKGSGRKPIYHDKYHGYQRKEQRKYDRKIAMIRKNHNCSFKEAQIILRERRLKELKKRVGQK